MQIRTKNGSGGYNISRQRVEGEVSREEMLFMRSSKKSDKYC